MLAPVVLFVYNRLDHTQRVIETLAKNELAKDTEFFVFSDAAKTEKGLEKVTAVREYINRTEWQSQFKNVTIVQAEKNKGLAKSVIGGVSEIIEKYGKVIVIEDDLILSPYFLNYMNGALDYYKNDSKIWAISGYTFPMRSLKSYPHDVYYSYRGSSWGWATWADRWSLVDWEVEDYAALMSSPERQKQFNRGGNDLVNMLRLQMEGKIDSWAVRWVYTQSKLDTYTVYPKYSYLGNGGCDGSGTHSGDDDEYDTDIQMSSAACKFETLEIDKKITREFWYKYSDTLDKKIIRNLKKILR